MWLNRPFGKPGERAVWNERVFYFKGTGPLGPSWSVFELRVEEGTDVSEDGRLGAVVWYRD